MSPVEVDGAIRPGVAYVLVNDVVTSGGTLASMAEHIRRHDGRVAGIVTVAASEKHRKIEPSSRTVRQLEERLGHAIRTELGIEPAALADAEAEYLNGLRTPDELRNRIAAARRNQAAAADARALARPDGTVPHEVGGFDPGGAAPSTERGDESLPIEYARTGDGMAGATRIAGASEEPPSAHPAQRTLFERPARASSFEALWDATPTPSKNEGDLRFTAWVASTLQQAGVRLVGHVVINHNRASWISPMVPKQNPDDVLGWTSFTIPAQPAAWRTGRELKHAGYTTHAWQLTQALAPDALTVAYLDAR